MELDAGLSRIAAPTLIVTTAESGLQSVEAVERYAKRFPDARVLVLPGDSYHIAAVEPDLCARHALEFIDKASRVRTPQPPRARRSDSACASRSIDAGRTHGPDR